MTDRERFEENAKAHGVKIIVSIPTMLTILSTNGKLETTYTFGINGKFEKSSIKWLDK